MRWKFILCPQIAQIYLAHLTGALFVRATAMLCGHSGRLESHHRGSCVSWWHVLLQTFLPCPFSYSESIPNPIPKLQKREKTQDILRFIDFVWYRQWTARYPVFSLECIQYAIKLHVRLRRFNCCGNCICQCRPFFVLRALALCGSSPKYVVFGLLVVIQSFLHLPSHHFHMRESPFFINFTSRSTVAWFWKYSRAWRLDRLDND